MTLPIFKIDEDRLEFILSDFKEFCIRNGVLITTKGYETISFEDMENDFSRLDALITELRDTTSFRLKLWGAR